MEKSVAELRHLSSANIRFGNRMIPIRCFPSYSFFFGEALYNVISLYDKRPTPISITLDQTSMKILSKWWKGAGVKINPFVLQSQIKGALDKVPVLSPEYN